MNDKNIKDYLYKEYKDNAIIKEIIKICFINNNIIENLNYLIVYYDGIGCPNINKTITKIRNKYLTLSQG